MLENKHIEIFLHYRLKDLLLNVEKPKNVNYSKLLDKNLLININTLNTLEKFQL